MKPRLLYLSPVTPSPTGNGLAMRAFHNLVSLAGSYDITLLVIPTGMKSALPDQEIRRLCGSFSILPVRPCKDFALALRLVFIKLFRTFLQGGRRPFEFRSLSPRRLREAAGMIKGKTFHVIHVFRLYLYPYAFYLLRDNRGARIQLDLDDFESHVRQGQSELLRREGHMERSECMAREAAAYERIERNWLRRFDRIFACSDIDKRRLTEAYGDLPVEVLPNVVAPPKQRTSEPALAPFVFLFLGAFSYFPNADGLDYLCGRVLPLLRKKKEDEFIIHIVGSGIKWRLRLRWFFDRRIRFHGWVAHIGKCYDEASAALAPIRTGGGTRIKIIEAIARRIPVVSTSKGIEGLKLGPGVDVLVGDTPQEMAACCRALLEQPDLRERLKTNAFAVFQRYYMPENLRHILIGSKAQSELRVRRP